MEKKPTDQLFDTKKIWSFENVFKAAFKNYSSAFQAFSHVVDELQKQGDEAITIGNILSDVGNTAESIFTKGLIGTGIDLAREGLT